MIGINGECDCGVYKGSHDNSRQIMLGVSNKFLLSSECNIANTHLWFPCKCNSNYRKMIEKDENQ